MGTLTSRVVVSDGQKAKKWYVEKLGFKVVLDGGHAVCVSPNVKGRSLFLHLCSGFEKVQPGNTGIGFTANDIEKTCRDFASKGVRFSVPLTDGDGYKMAKFLDPDGNEYWLFESRLAKKVVRRGARGRKGR